MRSVSYHKEIREEEQVLMLSQAWRLANIEYLEDKYRKIKNLYGGRIDMSQRESSFCWCFWSIGIPVSDLANSDGLIVRAMDESMNVQPRDMYWSVLGMMNNPWFRVAIIKEQNCLKFEHPTHPTIHTKGWMERVKEAGGDLLDGNWGQITPDEMKNTPTPKATVSMKRYGLVKEISLDEFEQHSSAESPWFVVEGEVYDGTKFVQGHPGGSQSIIAAAGTDATEDFLAIREISLHYSYSFF